VTRRDEQDPESGPEQGSHLLPSLPSADQRFFNESLQDGVRSPGALVRRRKKKERHG